MKIIAVIPARRASTRLPDKLLQPLGDKTVIRYTYDAVKATGLFDAVFVASDDSDICAEIQRFGGEAIRTRTDHACGSDRIAEAVADWDVDVIINVQGDEPFIDKKGLKQLIEVFHTDPTETIDLASLMYPLTDLTAVTDPNVVKVIVDQSNYALYFSRAPIPYRRDSEVAFYFQHIGVYAFRKQALMDFSRQPMTPLEKVEKIEAIRYLEYGKKIKMVETSHKSIGIDTLADLEAARKLVNQKN